MPSKPAPLTPAEVNQMTFASQDLWSALRTVTEAELIRWWMAERDPARQRVLEALGGVRKVMR